MKPSEVVVIAGRRAEWIRRFDPHYCNSDPILSDYLKVFEFVAERFSERPITDDKLKALGFVDVKDGFEWLLDRSINTPIDAAPIELSFHEDTAEGRVYNVWVGESKFRVKTMKRLRDILAVWGME